MGLFSFLFLERSEENYEKYIKNVEFNGVKNQQKLRKTFFDTNPLLCSYEQFLCAEEEEIDS